MKPVINTNMFRPFTGSSQGEILLRTYAEWLHRLEYPVTFLVETPKGNNHLQDLEINIGKN